MKATIEQAAAALRAMDDVLILCHRSPDSDTLGCAGALCRGLRVLGKRARFACTDPLTPKYAFLFEGLAAEDFEPKHVVTVDVATPELLGTLKDEWYGRVELCIDHHGTNSMEAPLVWVDPTAAAACEMVYALLLQLGVELTPPVADCLYAGLTGDTGCFKYQNVTPRTLRIAAALLECGAQGAEINRRFFDTKSRARVEMERQVYASLHTYFAGKCACVSLTEQMKKAAGAGEDDVEGLASLPRQIEGVLVGVTLVEQPGEGYKVSLRSTPPARVAEIAALFGGGGHPFAAGCRVQGPLPQAEAQIVDAVGDYFERNGL